MSKEDEGVSFRGLFVIDGKGILRQITINDLPVGRDVDETLRFEHFSFMREEIKHFKYDTNVSFLLSFNFLNCISFA